MKKIEFTVTEEELEMIDEYALQSNRCRSHFIYDCISRVMSQNAKYDENGNRLNISKKLRKQVKR